MTELFDATSQHESLLMIHLCNRDNAEWLRFEGEVSELFDVAPIPGIRCPRGLGPDAPELADVVMGEG